MHPNIFYIGGSWSSVNNLEYWNKGNTATTVNNNTGYKTIYSPSPICFVEPHTAAFSGFTTSGSFNNGRNFYCLPNSQGSIIFFASLGYRLYSSGVVSYYGGWGTYWTAGPSGTAVYARYLDSYISYVNPQCENYRAFGFTSRPVLE